jgi:hypothetical protein
MKRKSKPGEEARRFYDVPKDIVRFLETRESVLGVPLYQPIQKLRSLKWESFMMKFAVVLDLPFDKGLAE